MFRRFNMIYYCTLVCWRFPLLWIKSGRISNIQKSTSINHTLISSLSVIHIIFVAGSIIDRDSDIPNWTTFKNIITTTVISLDIFTTQKDPQNHHPILAKTLGMSITLCGFQFITEKTTTQELEIKFVGLLSEF